MGYALISARKVHLTSKINQLNYELMKISQQRHELHIYGSGLSDGYLDFEEMFGMPMALRPFALQYAMNGHKTALEGAGQDAQLGFAQLMGTPYGAQLPQEQHASLLNALFQQAFKTRLAEAKKAEEARIHVIENELDMKQKKLETQLAAANQELQSVEKGEEAAIGRATPKYA